MHPPLHYHLHRSRKLFEVDFFARCQVKGYLPPAAQKWNLGSLAYFYLFTQQRLTIKNGAGGAHVYGNLKDGADAIAEVERICDWLMDPIACPTTWPSHPRNHPSGESDVRDLRPTVA